MAEEGPTIPGMSLAARAIVMSGTELGRVVPDETQAEGDQR